MISGRPSWLHAALAALCACTSGGGHEADVVAAELTGPVHARVMQREHEEPAACDGVGMIERLTCIFGHTLTTCAWLEIDSPELAAHPFTKELNACQSLGAVGPRIGLGGATTGFELAADPKGLGRLAVRAGPNATIVWVMDGVVVGTMSATWPVVWRDVPTLDDKLVDFFSSADTTLDQRLLDYARKTGGEKAVVGLMVPVARTSVDRWYDLYDQLEDEKLKASALESLHGLARDERDVELVSSLIAYPDVQPAGFTKLLVATADEQISANIDWYTVAPVLMELEKRKDPAAAELACRLYGMQVLGSMPAVTDEYYEAGDVEAENGALAIIARHKEPCRWVQIALDRDPCSDSLRCLADGGLPNPDGEDALYDEETGEPLVLARPLCGRAVAGKASRAVSEEDEVTPLYPGPLLLSAGYTQGVISKELLQRNARRMYRFVYPPAPKPTAEQQEYGEVPEVPCQRPRDLSSAVCHLPLDVTEVSFSGCRLRIDDKAQVVRVEQLKAK